MSHDNLKTEIQRRLKPGKLIVLELDDDVEVILDDRALDDIEREEPSVSVLRVIDRVRVTISARRIWWAVQTIGVVDYIDFQDEV